jgi:sugar lactone lactonase YvrE
MRSIRAFVSMLALALSAGAQTYLIYPKAGGGLQPTPVAATSASVAPVSVATDSSGNVYFSSKQAVFKVGGGTLTRVAGAPGGANPFGDGGPATSASLNEPQGVAVDSAGNLYIVDNGERIRKVTGGTISTYAGTGSFGSTGNGGPATLAPLGGAYAVAVDSQGTLYIASVGDSTVRKVTTDGYIWAVAGNGTAGYSGDNGAATSASLNAPTGIAVDAALNVYIADYLNHRIRKVTPGGIITTVVGGGTLTPYNGAISTAIALVAPTGVAVDSGGDLYIADSYYGEIFRVTPDHHIWTDAGTGVQGYSGDGSLATSAELKRPSGVAVDTAGNRYILDQGNNVIRKVNTYGYISTVAGNGSVYYNGAGVAANAQFGTVYSTAVDSGGNLYVADNQANRVFEVNTSGVISTVAGTGVAGYNGDHIPAASAQLSGPMSVAVDSSGNVYIADEFNFRIRKVSGGTITTVAGNGMEGSSGDGGLATSAELLPTALAVNASGYVYFVDQYSNRVRMAIPGGDVLPVAGTGGYGFTGDNGLATSAEINNPNGLAFDSSGNLYIADTANLRVRMVSTAGIITTVAGNGVFGYSGDGGPATAASIGSPIGVAVVPANGIMYIASGNYVRAVSSGIISTVAGDGLTGYTGDNGLATSAEIQAYGVSVSEYGIVYLNTGDYGAVRELLKKIYLNGLLAEPPK